MGYRYKPNISEFKNNGRNKRSLLLFESTIFGRPVCEYGFLDLFIALVIQTNFQLLEKKSISTIASEKLI